MKKLLSIFLAIVAFTMIFQTAYIFAVDTNQVDGNQLTTTDTNATTPFSLLKKSILLDKKVNIAIAEGEYAIVKLNDYNSSIDTNTIQADVDDLKAIKANIQTLSNQEQFVALKKQTNTAIKALNKELKKTVVKELRKDMKRKMKENKKQFQADAKVKMSELKVNANAFREQAKNKLKEMKGKKN